MKWVVMMVGVWVGMMGVAWGREVEEDSLIFPVIHLTLLSFEGQEVQVTVRGDAREQRLVVEADSMQPLCFDDYVFAASASGVKSRFLELQYEKRCGTGCSMAPYYLIGVFKGRLQTVLPVETEYWYYEPPWRCDSLDIAAEDDHHVWQWQYTVLQEGDKYLLRRAEHHLIESECTPELNANTYDTTVLNFSTEFGVFYTRIDTVSGRFGRFGMNSPFNGVKHENAVCPMLEWGDRKLWFFEGAWCHRTEEGDFLCGEGRDCYYAK